MDMEVEHIIRNNTLVIINVVKLMASALRSHPSCGVDVEQCTNIVKIRLLEIEQTLNGDTYG